MKIALHLLALTLLLAACSSAPGDKRIRQALIGTWTADADRSGPREYEYKPDGGLIAKAIINNTNSVILEGTWQVKARTIIALLHTMKPVYWSNLGYSDWSCQVVSINDRKLVVLEMRRGPPVPTRWNPLLSMVGDYIPGTNVLTFTKR